MKLCLKELLKNKGSALISSLISIITISLIMGIIIINYSISNSADDSANILARIFCENRLSEVKNITNYQLESISFDICNDIYAMYPNNHYIEFMNGRGTFKHHYYYIINDSGEIIINKLEAYGE